MRFTQLGGLALVAGGVLATGSPRADAAANFSTTVPGAYPTIQEALDAAPRTGNTSILVSAGTYHESVFASGFYRLDLIALGDVTIVSDDGEPALTVCQSHIATVTGFTLESTTTGLYAMGDNHLTVKDTTIQDVGGDAVVADAPPLQTIQIYLDHGSSKEYVTITSTSVVLDECDIVSPAGHGVNVNVRSYVDLYATTIYAPGGDGVHGTGGGGRVAVEHSTITLPGDDGIDVVGHAVLVDDVRIDRPADTGVLVGPGVPATVRQAVVTGAGGDGIANFGFGTCDEVSQCTVTGAEGDGIRVASGSVIANVVTDAGGRGVVVTPPLAGLSESSGVSGNVVRDSGGTGILVAVNVHAVADNVVERAGGDGMNIAASGSGIAGNIVRWPAGNGIEVVGANDAIARNTVENAADHGIVVLGTAAEVETNFVSSTGGDGISVTSTLGVLRDNRVTGATGDGVVVGEGWSVVQGQEVDFAGGDGIAFVGNPGRANAQVAGNRVTGAGIDGIDLGATKRAKVTKNVVLDCVNCGIRLDDGAEKNRLARNTAKGNGDYDLYESSGSGRNVIERSNRVKTRHRRGAK